MTGAHPERGARERAPDRPGVQERSGALVGTAEERVGSTAEPDPGSLRSVHELPRLGHLDAQRLLRVDVLARRDGPQPHSTWARAPSG
jgi:hypothetical protein